jgi:tetratricopeptide (TPR) repeat protein
MQNLTLRPVLHIGIVFLFFFPLAVSGRNPDVEQEYRHKIDSLLSLLSSQEKSRMDFGFCREIATGYMALAKGDSAFYWAAEALKISRKTQAVKQEIAALQLLGNIQETVFKKYKPALEYYTAAAELANSHQESGYLHEVYTNILNLCFYLADFATAMRYATDGLNLSEKRGEQNRIAHYESLIGFIHLRQNNPLAAEKYYRRYLAFAVSRSDTLTIADVYTSLAECELALGRSASALGYMKESLRIYMALYAAKRLSKVDRIPYTLFKIG